MCCIQYTPSADTNSFSIGDGSGVFVDTGCTEDYVGIEGASQRCDNRFPVVASVICGTFQTQNAMTLADATVALTTICGE